MEYYWKLTYGKYGDTQTVRIQPGAVETVKSRWNRGEPIHLSTGSVPANQIRSFEISDEPYGQRHLLEAAAVAFHEPVYETLDSFGIKDLAVKAKWVKQPVTQAKWDKHYSSIPAYKYLGEEGSMAIMAFRIPIHELKPYHQLCTPEEIKRVDRMN